MALFVTVDAVGDLYNVVAQDDTPENRRAYRRHVAWWRRHSQSAEYRRRVPQHRWPALPVRIEVRP